MSFPLPPRPRRRVTDFEVEKKVVGEGSLAIVRRAIDKANGKTVALKAFERAYLRSNKKEADVTIEEHCLRRINHPGIVKLHASFRDEEWHYLVMEYCPGGELWENVRKVGAPKKAARHFLAQIFQAVQYLRDARIVHRDLKAENVIIGRRGNCKLVDFGSAKDLANPHVKGAGSPGWKTVQEDSVGTPNFMAPEVVKNKCSDFRSDTWSLGCMVFQILSGYPPFYGGSVVRVYKKISTGRFDIPPGWLTAEASDLIGRMVVKDPSLRLGGTDLVEIEEHPFFAAGRAGRSRPFQGAHLQPAPVLSLEELCLRRIGQRWSELKEQALSFVDVKGSSMREEVVSSLRRLSEVSELFDGKANEGETDLSGSEED